MLEIKKGGAVSRSGHQLKEAPHRVHAWPDVKRGFGHLDEGRNTTTEQMKMFLTRLGFGSKAVVTGDITQIDLAGGRTSGLVEAINVVGQVEGIAFVYFDERDVVRHKLVQAIVRAYEAYGNSNSASR